MALMVIWMEPSLVVLRKLREEAYFSTHSRSLYCEQENLRMSPAHDVTRTCEVFRIDGLADTGHMPRPLGRWILLHASAVDGYGGIPTLSQCTGLKPPEKQGTHIMR